MSIFDIFCTLTGVFLKADFRRSALVSVGFVCFCRVGGLGLLLFEKPFEVFSTPTTAGTRPKTLAQLARSARFFNSNKVDDFSSSNVKTETYRIVRFHKRQPSVCIEGEKGLESARFMDCVCRKWNLPQNTGTRFDN